MSFRQVVLAGVLASSLLGAVPAWADAPLVRNLPDFTALVQQEGRAVVNIRTTQTVRTLESGLPQELEGDPFAELLRRFVPPRQREQRTGSIGSGFSISGDGYILTNAHVVANAEKIVVTLADQRELPARLVGQDGRTDVALLKIEASGLPVVHTGNSNAVRVGEWVVAIGSPFGLDHSVTAGIVSAKGRQLPDEDYVPFIQTDAAVNPGNSGGPLFNLNGEVIGINSQIFSKSGGFMGISFAIPIDVALNVAEQLKQQGKVSRGRIGVAVQPVTTELAKAFGLSAAGGALLSSVEANGPAAKAGLRAGDILLKVNGQPVDKATDLARLISALGPNRKVQLEVWRDKRALSVSAVTTELVDDGPRAARNEAAEAPAAQPANRLGLTVRELPAQALRQLGVGYALQVLESRGPAEAAGVQRGDLIIGVAGQPLQNAAQLRELLSGLGAQAVVPLQIVRNGQRSFVALQLGKEANS